MSLFERYLTLWVALCIVLGIALGWLMPGLFQVIGAAEIANVNLPVAVLIWLMIIPMLVRIDLGALRGVAQHWRGISVTLIANWLVKPFTMALLGWVFIGWLFRPFLPADQIDSYIAGLILLGAAPCTAMVFVWSNLTKGEPHFTLSQVALNDIIMVFAFAPIVGLLLGLSAIIVPWATLSALGHSLHRRARDHRAGDPGADSGTTEGRRHWTLCSPSLQPLSIMALLATLVLLFAFQGEQILRQPLIILMLAVPITIQTYFIFGFGYLLNRCQRGGALHRCALGIDRSQQLFRVGRRCRHQPVRVFVGRRTRHRRGRPDRGAGDALARQTRQCEQGLVRAW